MKPARLAHCQTTSDSETLSLKIRRASLVDRNMCGWTSTQRTEAGTGICLVRGWSMPTVSTRPPNRLGAMLSTCTEPEATASPCIAYFSSSSFGSGAGSSALPATTAATAEAADPPSPEPSGMPLSISTSMPKSRFSASAIASSARPAVLRSASSGSDSVVPVIARMRTPRLALRVMRTRSPIASTVWPRMSKPTPTLPTVAGAKAVTTSVKIPFLLAGPAPPLRRRANGIPAPGAVWPQVRAPR